jgi:hypothetical protein
MLQIQYCTIDTFKSQSVAIILGLSPSLFGTTAGNIRFMHEQLYTIMAPKLHGPLACDSYPIFRQKIGLRFARYHTTSTYFLEMENFQLFNTLLTQLGNQTNLVLCGCPIHFVPFPAKDDMPTMISRLDQQEQVLSGHVALRLSLIWPFTQNNHDTIQKMKHLAGYAPIMSYPYCWQPQEPSLFLVYFKSNPVTNQYNNLSPDKFMPLSLLLVMPTMNHEEYPMPQEAATRGGAIAMDADDSDETTLDTSDTRSAKRLRPTKSNAPGAATFPAAEDKNDTTTSTLDTKPPADDDATMSDEDDNEQVLFQDSQQQLDLHRRIQQQQQHQKQKQKTKQMPLLQTTDLTCRMPTTSISNKSKTHSLCPAPRTTTTSTQTFLSPYFLPKTPSLALPSQMPTPPPTTQTFLTS